MLNLKLLCSSGYFCFLVGFPSKHTNLLGFLPGLLLVHSGELIPGKAEQTNQTDTAGEVMELTGETEVHNLLFQLHCLPFDLQTNCKKNPDKTHYYCLILLCD